MDMLDINNIKMEVLECSNNNSNKKWGITVNKINTTSTNTKFGIEFTIEDTIGLLANNQNYDYTIRVTINAKDGTGYITTDFVVKLKVN